jgi:Mrp family chromosome partitioning ATPase
MRAVIAELERRYALVVIDSSPVTVVPDSIPILRQVSGVLVVMRESKTTTEGALRLRDQLAHLGVAPLGLVMNRTPPISTPAYYGYYSYAPAKAAAAANGQASVGAPLEEGRRATRRRKREEAAAPEA